MLPLLLQLLLPLIQKPPPTTPMIAATTSTPFIPMVPPLPPRLNYYYPSPNYYQYQHPFFGFGYLPSVFRKGNIAVGKEKSTLNINPSLARVPNIKSILQNTQKNIGKPKRTTSTPLKERNILSPKRSKMYRRVPVPGTTKYVTIQTKDLREYVNIFFDGKRFTIKTRDLLSTKSIPSMIRKIQVYNRNK